MPGDHLAFIEIKTGNAHQGYLDVVDYRFAADGLVNTFSNLALNGQETSYIAITVKDRVGGTFNV